LVAKLSDRPVNEEPRCREVAGFFRFRVNPQGFTRWCTPDRTAERAARQIARAPLFHLRHASGGELSDSLVENIDPVNNPVGFAPRRKRFHKCRTHVIAGGGPMRGLRRIARYIPARSRPIPLGPRPLAMFTPSGRCDRNAVRYAGGHRTPDRYSYVAIAAACATRHAIGE
jgi:hypothetical protein